MTVRKIIAIACIFAVTAIAWMILGAGTSSRTHSSFSSLKSEVASLYGGDLVITTPLCYTKIAKEMEEVVDGRSIIRKYEEKKYFDLVSSDISIRVKKDERKRGNLWFPTFKTGFSGDYVFDVSGLVPGQELFLFTTLDSKDSIYDNIRLAVNGVDSSDLSRLVRREEIPVSSGDDGLLSFSVSYNSTGMERLEYLVSGSDASEIAQIRNFSLAVTTDFNDFDFPSDMMSPTEKTEFETGWELVWSFENSVTGKNIGLIVPNRLNPGEIVTRVTFFAPVSLLFFFAVLLVFSAVLKVTLHPVHFMFLAATFFSFHLMYSYFSDHMNLFLTFGISSVVSLLLTITYLRLFTPRIVYLALAPLTQMIYLVVFSFSFFFDGTTGVIVTVCSVVTLFILMQVTGRMNWDEVFTKK